MRDRLRQLVLGAPKNLFDPSIHRHLALIAFFAWVGLGSDGLSSSCYGPEEIYRQLGEHRHLALYLAAAVVATVFLISASYAHIIEQFPSGGGGYLVASKLLGPIPGVTGAFVATGHGPWGMLNAPATGLALAELIAGGAPKVLDLRPFDPAR